VPSSLASRGHQGAERAGRPLRAAAATVFVVDDDVAVRKSLHALSESAGLAVETYGTGEEFLAAYDPERAGCLVLDVRLREGSGLDLQDELRRRKATLPIIVLTGHGDVQTSVRALKAGAVDFLQKPAPPAVLLERIGAAMELDRQTRASTTTRSAVTARKRVTAQRGAPFVSGRVARIKHDLLATVAHELRSPTNAIVMWAHLLRWESGDPDAKQRALDGIDRGARRQALLIDDLLDFSRIAKGKLALHVGPVDLRRAVQDALEWARPSAESKHIRFEADLVPSPVIAACDVDRLQQVFSNVLSNAIKFTPVAGRVAVRLRTEADWAVLTVTDSGCGISPAFLPHVFEPFRQANTSATRHDGLGLGLAIVREIVAQHDGTVTAESLGEGQGATFIVSLPTLAASSA